MYTLGFEKAKPIIEMFRKIQSSIFSLREQFYQATFVCFTTSKKLTHAFHSVFICYATVYIVI